MAQSDKASVTYDTLLDCEAIENELLRYNSREWFRQAKNTPFGHGDLLISLDMMGLLKKRQQLSRAHAHRIWASP
jgi:hypothetical protein